MIYSISELHVKCLKCVEILYEPASVVLMIVVIVQETITQLRENTFECLVSEDKICI